MLELTGLQAVYVAHLLLFKSGRTWTRALLYLVTEGIALGIWQQLVGMAKKGSDLGQAGMTA